MFPNSGKEPIIKKAFLKISAKNIKIKTYWIVFEEIK